MAVCPSVPVCILQHRGCFLLCPLCSLICPLATELRLSKRLLNHREERSQDLEFITQEREPNGGLVPRTFLPVTVHTPTRPPLPPPLADPHLLPEPSRKQCGGYTAKSPSRSPRPQRPLAVRPGLRPRTPWPGPFGCPGLDCAQLWSPQKSSAWSPVGVEESWGELWGVRCFPAQAGRLWSVALVGRQWGASANKGQEGELGDPDT